MITMRRLLAAVLLALAVQHAAPGRQQPALDREFELIRAVAAGGPVGGAEPALVRAAFEEALADAVVTRLYATPPLVAGADRALEALAAAAGDAARVLAGKVPRVEKGANPFDPAAEGVERALALVCAVEQVRDPEDPASAIRQKGRVEEALAAARAVDSAVLTGTCLAWLGLYAVQGGDVTVARRFLSEAAGLAARSGNAYAGLTAHRYLSLTYALESDVAAAAREAEEAERIVAARSVSDAVLESTGPELYADLVDYALRLGDRTKAVEWARRAVALLEALAAPAAQRAEALERLGQLHAQSAAGSPDDARRGAVALAAAAALREETLEQDRAILDYTGAGVLLFENATPAEARPALEKARDLARHPGLEDLLSGVEYWLGRTHLAESVGGNSKTAAAAFERGVALLGTALERLERLERSGAETSELRMTLTFWLGRAYLEGPSPKPREAAGYLRRAFGAALEAEDVNSAVACAELELRATSASGGAAAVRQTAADLYDRLAASGRIDPLNAANALAIELGRIAPARDGLSPAVVAFYDHVVAALGRTHKEKAPRAAAALVTLAAAGNDRALLAARADAAFGGLVAAKADDAARDLAEAVWGAWLAIGDAAETSRWRGRYEALATAAYEAVRGDAKRAERALQLAEGLARAARSRSDAAAVARWTAAVADHRRAVAEALERDGKLGLAVGAWRAYATALSDLGRHEEAGRWYAHAGETAARVGDREGQAAAIAGRARAELGSGNVKAALVSAREAAAAYDALAAAAADAGERARLEARARESRALAAEIEKR